jgi:rubrerythrin
LGLGRPEEEMRLEEEEAPKPKELKIEEETEEVETIREAVEKVEAVRIKTFKIGDHETLEELKEGEDVSYLRCLRCGLVVRLDEVSRLSEAKCIGGATEQVTEQARKKTEISRCGYCGRSLVVGIYPTEYVEGSPIEVPLCEECAKKVEEFYLKARPNVSGLTRKARVRCKHPLEGQKMVAWHHATSTWYVRGEDGTWPCPLCHASFDRLLDVVKHFMERHHEPLTKTGREYVHGVGDVSKTWQGYYCPICGLLCFSQEVLKDHYRSHGGG